MAKFFVGQRVRKVFTPNPKAPVKVGSEGVVSEIGFRPKGSPLKGGGVLSEDNDLWVRYGSKVYSEVSKYIEPILPEGSAPSEFTFQQLMESLQEVSA
ncbi:TPA: hypothetical protein R4K21_003186 [Stenotrophomonas maltophilia]|nr:hypothetical protein [Stenotrophomonas maltophilia]